MNKSIEQFIATSKTSLQTMEGMTSRAHAGIEKLVELHLTTSKAALGESFGHAQSLLGAKDAQEIMSLQSGLTQPLVEKSAVYVQQVQSIATGAGTEFAKAVEAHLAEAHKAFSGLVETFAKNAPAGAESAMAAFKNALTLGQNAVESAQTSAKKAVEVAQSSLASATSDAVEATKKAAKSA